MAKSQTKKEKFRLFVSKGNCDYQILFITIALVLFGIMMVYSSSSYRQVINGNAADTLARKQARFALYGFIALFVISKINYRFYHSFGMLAMLTSIFLSVAVFIIGKASGGATRWIPIGSFQFQPSEFAKPAIMVYVAGMCSDHPKWLKNFWKTVFIMLLPAINILLIMKENLSTGLICAVIVIAMILVAAPDWKVLINPASVGLVTALGTILYFALTSGDGAYRKVRILAWRHPEQYPDDTFQTLQSMYAIGSGGIAGRGLGQSIQKTGNLPESHNDMIFAIICEELGLIGGLILLAAFVMLIIRLMHICNNTQDVFGGLLMLGIMIHIGTQLLINIGVVTNTIPNTGVTLPFVSYGGTSLVFLMAEIGMAMSISRQQKFEE